MATWRPAGPMVHLTASASRSTPFFISRRAASWNMICLVAIGNSVFAVSCWPWPPPVASSWCSPVVVGLISEPHELLARGLLEPLLEPIVRVPLPIPDLAVPPERGRVLLLETGRRAALVRDRGSLVGVQAQELVHLAPPALRARVQG